MARLARSLAYAVLGAALVLLALLLLAGGRHPLDDIEPTPMIEGRS